MQSTGESNTYETLARDGFQGKIISPAYCIVRRLLEVHFPHPGDHGIEGGHLAAKYDELLHRIEKMEFPLAPLDDLIDRLGGPTAVAEMTGRSARIVRRHGILKFEQRSSTGGTDSLNIEERQRFQNGKKLLAIISDAASTGVSLQADKRVPNQRRRVHITLELPWSADRAVQQLGRSHRSNQSSAPIYKILISNIGWCGT